MSGTSSSDELRRGLQEEAGIFPGVFPGLLVRFAEVLGRRLSHLAGECTASATGDLRLDLTDSLVAYVSGPWHGMEDDLRLWAADLVLRLPDMPRP